MSNADPRVRDPAEGTCLLCKQVELLSHLRFCCKPGEFLAPVVLLATLTYLRDRSYTMTKETEDGSAKETEDRSDQQKISTYTVWAKRQRRREEAFLVSTALSKQAFLGCKLSSPLISSPIRP